MQKIVVLGGAGAMGQVIVHDLLLTSSATEIAIADLDIERANQLKSRLQQCQSLEKKLSTVHADIQNRAELISVLKNATIVVNSTPYYFNVEVMHAALEAHCHYVDLGGLFHMTRKQLELHDQFAKSNLLAILGIGAAPGITNVMAAAAAKELQTVHDIAITIGCADFIKNEHPFVAPYALDTILDEYTKQPMVFENGAFEAKAPMSGELEIKFPAPVSSVKAILTLHSEIATLPISYKSKGIRNVTFRLGLPLQFHEKLKFLVELGLASTDGISIDDAKVIPRKVLAKLIDCLPAPVCDPNDCEVIRVDVKGTIAGSNKFIRMETIVRSHDLWNISSGALDTGVPPSIVAELILNGHIQNRGVLAPETCVPSEPFFEELDKRSIAISQTRMPVNEEIIFAAEAKH